MAQVMIMVMEAGKAEHTCNLLADINKNGEVTKLYDYNGNELKINFLQGQVYYNKTWWQFTKKQDI
ncbi:MULTISPECIES: hypothetical protein [Acinetobacter calcoaceticus/baumannii complex]|uniref:hypothetical protein n=1 Tax=Acinetobacter calcoaceticus/baumannii complex TaxID=909768 RepID=UPI0007072500|nr:MULTISPECIES: hypothetical protein [Acinetobacter calcoaceticus/baumannii complex]AZC10088.1 hypothetical protein DKE47_013675 [Acinetobacter nosocomialis]KQE45848.1 hypothetical protein APD45_04310 [Acinetobacter baumannii]MBR7735621.1 hypothetical protein [Acinetobacter nosocomialis]MCX3052965.1 hypothetical protein [Acinetobacter baumannii]HBM1866127.1 hypothetical protein [Acinetobacter nosocomialis]